MNPTLILLLLACGGAPSAPLETAETPEPTPDPEASDLPPVPTEDVGDGAVQLSGRVLRPGEPLDVTFLRPGRNGCYRQGPVTTTLGDHRITHTYTTSSEGTVCTQAMVPGGFKAHLDLPASGTWQGVVIVDGKEVAVYFVDVAG